MSTCQTVCNLALSAIGIIGAGETPEAADSALALQSLKGYYQKLINSGTFGSLADVIPAVTEYLSGENERIVHDGTVTVTLPVELPAYYETSQYGFLGYEVDPATVRPPRDLSVVSVVRTDTGAITDHLYDNRLRSWIDVHALTANAAAPLSHRDENGLASALAMRVAPHFGQEPTRETAIAAARFEEALCNQWSVAREAPTKVDYF
jgi:hypothetical protein